MLILFFSSIFGFGFGFQDRASLCRPGYPGIHSIVHAGLKLPELDPSVSASRVLGLKVGSTMSACVTLC